MVGLVLVSHSKKLAEAVRELVLQMTGARLSRSRWRRALATTTTNSAPTPSTLPKWCRN